MARLIDLYVVLAVLDDDTFALHNPNVQLINQRNSRAESIPPLGLEFNHGQLWGMIGLFSHRYTMKRAPRGLEDQTELV
jgi:hypothetical protein